MSNPTLDEKIHEIHYQLANNSATLQFDMSKLVEKADKDILPLIKEENKRARIDELISWFDLPHHYKGEEYRDEPFVKVKCKTPKSIRYQTLDSHFTYSVLNRLSELENK